MKRRVLVVDDEETARDSMAILLRRHSFEVEVAATGEEGVEMVRRTDFHLVLLDLWMPGLGGLQALRQMKSHDPSLPVVVLTGDSALGSVKEAMRLLAEDYLCKPAEPEHVLDCIRRFMRTVPETPGDGVVVVDGDPTSLESILAVLRNAEISARGFLDPGPEFLEALLGEAKVLLADLRLVDANGLHVVRKILKLRPGVGFILLTGYPSPETVAEAARLGAVDCLVKPVEIPRLLEAVRRALDRARPANGNPDLRPGSVFGTADGSRARALFQSLVSCGFAGICVADDPAEFQDAGPDTVLLRAGDGGDGAFPHVATFDQVVHALRHLCSGKKRVVLIDAPRFIAARVPGSWGGLALSLRDAVAGQETVLICRYPPGRLDERKRCSPGVEVLPERGNDSGIVWEIKAANLGGDESVAYNLIRTAGGRLQQAGLATATGFSRARVSRVLTRLQKRGLLMRQRDGAGNCVVLT